jgi:hypothetical protein
MSTPGPLCSITNPEAVSDGTLTLRGASGPVPLGSRGKPQGGLALIYSCWLEGARATEDAIPRVLGRTFDTGVSTLNFQQSLVGNEIHNASEKAQAYVRNVLDKIANAADWDALNKLARPILGQSSLSAGVFYGVAESLVGDAVSLLSMGKMLVLAGIYERIKNGPLTLLMDPTSLALAITVRTVPVLWNEARKCDDAFWGLIKELLEIAAHPLKFAEVLGKNIIQSARDDWNKLNAYAVDRTVTGDFQAGRIIGRVLYQVVMAILLVMSVAGAVAKIAARFPWLIRLARYIKSGGELAELGEVAEGGKTAEGVVETMKASEADATAPKPKPKPEPEPQKPPEKEQTPKAPVRERPPGKFGDAAKLQDHNGRHGADFGAKSAAEYEQQADTFLNTRKASGVLEKVRPNGDIVRYNPATDEFGVVKPDGTVRTYYKPDPAVHGYPTNMDYFNAQ